VSQQQIVSQSLHFGQRRFRGSAVDLLTPYRCKHTPRLTAAGAHSILSRGEMIARADRVRSDDRIWSWIRGHLREFRLLRLHGITHGTKTQPRASSLSIYHGVFQTMDGSIYRLGVALHDLRNPARIIGVGDSWILQLEDPWEITGYVHNVVFTCGAVAESDGTVKIYWGGADTVMCVGEATVSDLVALCLDHGRPAK